MVHSIVKAHDGAIDLDSTVGRGTTVTCFFPALTVSPAEERAETAAPPEGHGERVLLVDDEISLAQRSGRRLESLGYRVTTESDPLHALGTFSARPRDFDLLISDDLMPGMVGLDLARAVHDIRPDLPIALLTGFIEDLAEETLRTAGVRRLIGRPATLQELAVAVHAVLQGARVAT